MKAIEIINRMKPSQVRRLDYKHYTQTKIVE